MFHSHHVDDIGRVLLQAQEDIAALRGRIGEEGTTSTDLEAVLSRAEADLRSKAELVLSAVTQNNAEALGPVPSDDYNQFSRDQQTPSPYNHFYGGYDEHYRGNSAESPVDYAAANARGSSQYGGGNGGYEVYQQQPQKYSKQFRRQPNSRTREKLDDARAYEYMRNPTSVDARRYLREKFGIPFEKVETHRRGSKQKKKKRLYKGPVTRPTGVLPVQNRVDPAAPPPDISEKDIQGGIMNLVNRGFIPPNVDLSAAFSRGAPPVTQAPVKLHQFQDQFAPKMPYVAPFLSDIANIKLDVAHVVKTREESILRAKKIQQEMDDEERQKKLDAQLLQHTSTTSSTSGSQAFASALGSLGPGPSGTGGSKISGMETKQQIDKIRGYNELLDQYSLHQFIIRRGKVLDMTPEFQSFQRTHVADWGPITTVIKLLEELLTKFSVPMAYIDGHSVINLAERAELETRPTPEELLNCIANIDQVGSLIRIPGRRFTKDEGGRNRASLVIQTSWRRFLCRREYVAYHIANEAAAKIQLGWRQAQQYQEARQKIRDQRDIDDTIWKALVTRLRSKWSDLKRKRHVVIHLPSMSREEHQRATIPHLQSRMNLQMVRLCNTIDPLVDVVYVAPMDIPDDVKRYYSRLLEVGGIKDPNLRYKIVVPENAERFPSHISLTSLLLYSPRCLRKIKRYIKGRDAYIVPDQVGPEERRLAVLLGIPILAPEPSVSAQCSLKSGAKKLFASADVSTAPGAHDIYEEPELIGALSKLIAAYIDVPRWMIKLDDEYGGRGNAFFDTDSLIIVRSLREAHRKHTSKEPNYWGRPDVQEGARNQLTRELDSRLVSLLQLNKLELYPNGVKDFLLAMGRCGAVVEAVPGDVRGSPSVNLFISPDGNVQMTSTHDQLFSCNPKNPYIYHGCTFPQRSVPHAAIRGAALAVGGEMYKKGIIGHANIDFVSFYDDYNQRQRLWAVDLNIGMSRSQVVFTLTDFLLRGSVETSSGEYLIQPMAVEELPSALLDGGSSISSVGGSKSDIDESTISMTSETRSYVALDCIYHPNLGAMQYGAFFNLCRLHGVSFDLQQRMGTAFMLTDSLVGGMLGLIGVGKETEDALKNVHKSIRFIETQVGSLHEKSEFDSEKSNFEEISKLIKRKVEQLNPEQRNRH